MTDRKQAVTRAAALSVGAALFLTTIKFFVGFLTNSIGVISEGLHSALDLIAAAITFLAVRTASADADEDHTYGHGKIENFAALAETIILWATAVWILYEAVRRITLNEYPAPNPWGLAVMIVSTIVVYQQARMLYRTAEEHSSQALEADALHFSTDMISSIVVLIGLVFVQIGFPIGDPVAAIGVSIVIFIVSYRLGKRAFDHLIDKAPEGIRERVQELCLKTPGVVDCSRVRARTAGPELFVDVVVIVDRTIDIESAVDIAEKIEEDLREISPKVDVVIQMKPVDGDNIMRDESDVYSDLQAITKRNPLVVGVHKVRIFSREDGTHIAADLEMQSDLTLEEAHEASEVLEEELRQRVPDISRISFHLESTAGETSTIDVTSEQSKVVEKVKEIVENRTRAQDCHNIVISEEAGGFVISFDCRLDGSIPLSESHEIAELIEHLVIKEIPGVQSVIVHMEPL